MAVKNWNGRTIEIEDGYFTEESLKAMRERLAKEKAAKEKQSTKAPAKKSTKSTAKKPSKKGK